MNLAELTAGDPVRVMDDHGSAGWPGRVTAATADTLEVHYGGATETFRRADGRRGHRYLTDKAPEEK
jgi:hypothetical protein